MSAGAAGAASAGTGLIETPAVELSALRFSYKQGRDVLAIDSLTIARGETVFLHGPSGSGKTTLLGLLAGVLFSLEFASIFASLLYTSASRATIFAYTAPFWVSLLLPLRVKSEHLNRSQWLGLVLAFAAVLLAFVPRLPSAEGSNGLGLSSGSVRITTGWPCMDRATSAYAA